MTIPSSGSISLGDVLNELRVSNSGRAYPISLGDADVRALAGVPSGDISMSSLYGKSAVLALQATGNNDSGFESTVSGAGSVSAYPSVSYSGGSGAKTIQWSILSSTEAVSLINANSAQCQVKLSFGRNTTGYTIVYLRCVVSDSTGSVTVDNIIAELRWGGSTV